MNPETAAVSSPNLLHCQHRSLSGRRFCRLAISDPDSGLCSRHAAEHQRDLVLADLAPALIGTIEEFRSAADINHSLGELYKLQARNKITPRRAAVMAYTAWERAWARRAEYRRWRPVRGNATAEARAL